MKKFLFTISALIAFGANALAADIFEVEDVAILPASDSQANIVVNYTLDSESSCGGYDFKITLPAGIEPIMDEDELTYTLGDCYKKAPSVVTGYTAGTRTLEVHVACGDPLQKQSGTLISILVKATSDLSIGTLDAQLHNADFIDYTTTFAHDAADVDFSFIVSNTITLDETSTEVPAAATGVNVLVKRTISANHWNTICLPFAMSETQVKEAFGDDVKLANFVDYDTQENGDDVIGITMNFVSATAIAANHPYLIRTTSKITQFSVDGVDINSDEDNAVVEYDNGLTGKKRVVYGTFYGILHSGEIIPDKDIFLSGNKFYYSTGTTTIMGFRGYFELLDDLAGYAPSFDIIIDGNTTDINEFRGLFEDGAIYDLNGMKIENPTKKGVYIQNGKKVVIKK